MFCIGVIWNDQDQWILSALQHTRLQLSILLNKYFILFILKFKYITEKNKYHKSMNKKDYIFSDLFSYDYLWLDYDMILHLSTKSIEDQVFMKIGFRIA